MSPISDARRESPGQRWAHEVAPGKVNMGLAVLTRRGDGFHEVETLLASLDLVDDVRVDISQVAAGEGVVTLTVVPAPVGRAPGWVEDSFRSLPLDRRNLVVRAVERYIAAAGAASVNVHVTLTKRVPVAAGLGGGSSDAAAALRAMSTVMPADVDVRALAAELGSDVPYFLMGTAAAIGRGRGERLEDVAVPAVSLVLAKPPLEVSAADAYAGLVGFTPRLRPLEIVTALREGTEPAWRNGLQPGVQRAHPAVRDLLGLLRRMGLRSPLMSGSGPTCFGVATDPAEAEELAAAVAAEDPTLWVATAITAPGTPAAASVAELA